jgi:hypothetical protein
MTDHTSKSQQNETASTIEVGDLVEVPSGADLSRKATYRLHVVRTREYADGRAYIHGHVLNKDGSVRNLTNTWTGTGTRSAFVNLSAVKIVERAPFIGPVVDPVGAEIRQATEVARRFGWSPDTDDAVVLADGSAAKVLPHGPKQSFECRKCNSRHAFLDVRTETSHIVGAALCEMFATVETTRAYLVGRAEHLDAEIAMVPGYPANERWAAEAAELRAAAASLDPKPEPAAEVDEIEQALAEIAAETGESIETVRDLHEAMQACGEEAEWVDDLTEPTEPATPNPHYHCGTQDTRPCPTGEHRNPEPLPWSADTRCELCRSVEGPLDAIVGPEGAPVPVCRDTRACDARRAGTPVAEMHRDDLGPDEVPEPAEPRSCVVCGDTTGPFAKALGVFGAEADVCASPSQCIDRREQAPPVEKPEPTAVEGAADDSGDPAVREARERRERAEAAMSEDTRIVVDALDRAAMYAAEGVLTEAEQDRPRAQAHRPRPERRGGPDADIDLAVSARRWSARACARPSPTARSSSPRRRPRNRSPRRCRRSRGAGTTGRPTEGRASSSVT